MRRRVRNGIFTNLSVLSLCFLLLFSGCARQATGTTKTSFAMGSLLTATVYTDEPTAAQLCSAVFSAANELDGRISATDEKSELSALNTKGAAVCSEETYRLLQDAAELCTALDGRLDITLGSVTSLWGFATDTPRLPAKAEIRTALETAGLSALRFDDAKRTVTPAPGQQLDPGAIGKGAACDAAKAVLDSAPAPAVISFGGTVMVYGAKPGDGQWRVGVRDPHGAATEYCGLLTLTPESDTDAYFISTSGSYEKNFTQDGVTYHHILDPDTGYPVRNDLIGVSVVSKNGMTGDALSTALFVEGLTDRALDWTKAYLEGAVFLFADGGVYVTDGLRDRFTLTNTADYHMTDET